MTTLDEILATTRAGLPALRLRRAELERAAAIAAVRPNFRASLTGESVAVIAEVKRRSPSAGPINVSLDPVELASAYEAGGAAAISVLTDIAFFGGSVADLAGVAGAVNVPVLRKDFIVDELQLVEARAVGASAALLIVRALNQRTLEHLLGRAAALGLSALVETHTADEVARAIDAGATIIGVNARDLDTFTIDMERAWRLLALVPAGLVAVAESGMATVGDVVIAADHGADAVLIGSALARSETPENSARAVSQVARRGR